MPGPPRSGTIHSPLARVLHTRSAESAGGEYDLVQNYHFLCGISDRGRFRCLIADFSADFNSYRCADGTRFITGFYADDSRAYLQIDGVAVTLKKRLALSGARYSGSGVTLVITGAGTTIKHVGRPVTACELT